MRDLIALLWVSSLWYLSLYACAFLYFSISIQRLRCVSSASVIFLYYYSLHYWVEYGQTSSKIIEVIMNTSICTNRVLVCSYILLSYVWTMRWEVRVTQALTAYSHMYHVNHHWRSRTIHTPRARRVRGHRTPEYQRAPWQPDELRRDYNRLYRFPFSRRSGSYCDEDPRVQSY